MKREEKDFIKKQRHSLSNEEIARKLNIKRRKVDKYVQSLDDRDAPVRPSRECAVLPEKNKLLALFGVFVVLGVLIYGNTFNAEFQFDDHHYIVNNPTITDIDNLYQFSRLPPTLRMRYVAFYTFTLNYAWGGLNVTGYHLFNLGIHVVTGLLVFWLSYMIFLTPRCKNQRGAQAHFWVAFFAALIFLAHPLQTQAVTYITQRFASLATMFYVASACFYLMGRMKRIIWPFFAALLCAVLAMFTKQITITLPLIIILSEIILFEGAFLKRGKGLMLLFVLICVGMIVPALHNFNAINVLSMRAPSESHMGDMLTPGIYLLTQMRVIMTYLKLLVWPAGQNLDYDFSASTTLFEPVTFLSFMFLSIVFVWGIAMVKKRPAWAFCVFWFFVTLSVESSVITLYHVIFEHRMYLPMVGCSLLISSVVFQMTNDQRVSVTVLTLMVVILSVLTFQRNETWASEISLWSDVVEKSPHKYRGYYTLGMAYNKKGDHRKMIEWFNKGRQAAPENPEAYNNLGKVYSRSDPHKALAYFKQAVELDPEFVEAYTNLGAMHAAMGQTEEAAKVFRKAIELNPRYAPGYNNLGTIYMRQGKFAQARSLFERALQRDPKYEDARSNLNKVKQLLEKR